MELYDTEVMAFDRHQRQVNLLEDIAIRQQFGMADQHDLRDFTRIATESFAPNKLATSISMEMAPGMLLAAKIALGSAFVIILIAAIKSLFDGESKVSSSGEKAAKSSEENKELLSKISSMVSGKSTEAVQKVVKDTNDKPAELNGDKTDKAVSAVRQLMGLVYGTDQIPPSDFAIVMNNISQVKDIGTWIKVIYDSIGDPATRNELIQFKFTTITVNGVSTGQIEAIRNLPEVMTDITNYLENSRKVFSKLKHNAQTPVTEEDKKVINAEIIKTVNDKLKGFLVDSNKSLSEQLTEQVNSLAQPIAAPDAETFNKLGKHIEDIANPSGTFKQQEAMLSKLKEAKIGEKLDALRSADGDSASTQNNADTLADTEDRKALANTFATNISQLKSLTVPLLKLANVLTKGSLFWATWANAANKQLKAVIEFNKSVSGTPDTQSYSFESESGNDVDTEFTQIVPSEVESVDIFTPITADELDVFQFHQELEDAHGTGSTITTESFNYLKRKANRHHIELKPIYRRTLLAQSISTESLSLGVMIAGLGVLTALSALTYFLWSKFLNNDKMEATAAATSDQITKAEESTDNLAKRIENQAQVVETLNKMFQEHAKTQSGTDRDNATKEALRKANAVLASEVSEAVVKDTSFQQDYLNVFNNHKPSVAKLLITIAHHTAKHNADKPMYNWVRSKLIQEKIKVISDASYMQSLASTFIAIQKNLRTTQSLMLGIVNTLNTNMQAITRGDDGAEKVVDDAIAKVKTNMLHGQDLDTLSNAENINFFTDNVANELQKALTSLLDNAPDLTTADGLTKAAVDIKALADPMPQDAKLEEDPITEFLEFQKSHSNLISLFTNNDPGQTKVIENLGRDHKNFQSACGELQNKLKSVETSAPAIGQVSQLIEALAKYSQGTKRQIDFMIAWYGMIGRLTLNTGAAAAKIKKLTDSLGGLFTKINAADEATKADPVSTDSYHAPLLPTLRGVDLEAFNEVDFTAIPDHEYPEYLDALNDEIKQMNDEATRVQELKDYLNAEGLVSQHTIIELEQYFPGLTTRRMPLATFTKFPSKTNLAIAMEDAGLAATAAGVAVIAAVAALSFKMGQWLLERFRRTRDDVAAITGLSDSIKKQLDKLAPLRGAFVTRYDSLSPAGKSEFATKLNKFVTGHGGVFNADQTGDGDAVATEIMTALVQAGLKAHYSAVIADLTADKPLHKCLPLLTEVIIKNVSAVATGAREAINKAKSATSEAAVNSVVKDWHIAQLGGVVGAGKNEPDVVIAELKAYLEKLKAETNVDPSLDSLTVDKIGPMFDHAVKLAKATTPDVDKRVADMQTLLNQTKSKHSGDLKGTSEVMKATLKVISDDMKRITDLQSVHSGIVTTAKQFLTDVEKVLKNAEKAFNMKVKDKVPKPEDGK